MSKSHRNNYRQTSFLSVGFEVSGCCKEDFRGRANRRWFKRNYSKGRRRADLRIIKREVDDYPG